MKKLLSLLFVLSFALLFSPSVQAEEEETPPPTHINITSTALQVPAKLTSGNKNFPVMEVEVSANAETKLYEIWVQIETESPEQYKSLWFLNDRKKKVSTTGELSYQASGIKIDLAGPPKIFPDKPFRATLWAESQTFYPPVDSVFRAVHAHSTADTGSVEGTPSDAMNKAAYKGTNKIVVGVRGEFPEEENKTPKPEEAPPVSSNTEIRDQNAITQEDESKAKKLQTHLALRAAFSDLSTAHKNRDAINKLKESGIIGGYPDGTFKPSKSVNRAEFTKIVIGAKYASELESCDIDSHSFPDVPADAWFAPYVCVAKSKGVIKGYPDGTFGPENNIKFVEAAKIVAQLFATVKTSDSEVWYQPFVETLEGEAAIPDDVNTLEHELSRAQMSELIYRLKWKIRNKASKRYQDLR